MKRKDLVGALVQAACALDKRKLWERFDNFHCFGIRIAGSDEPPMLGCVMGAAGEEYGLALFRGANAAATLTSLLDPQGSGDDTVEEMDTVQFSMEPFGELAAEDQAFIREAGLHPPVNERVPLFIAKRPYRQVRPPDESEMATFLLVLQAVLEAEIKELLYPTSLEDEEEICVLDVRGEPDNVHVEVTRERWESETSPTTIPLYRGGHELGSLPGLETTWLVGLPSIPAAVDDDDRTMLMLLVFDGTSELIVQSKPVVAGQMQEAVDVLIETFGGKNMTGVQGVPRRVFFSSRKLCQAMTPMLAPLGVQCHYEGTIPELEAIAEELLSGMGDNPSPFGDFSEVLGEETDEVPAADDMVSWRLADGRLLQRFAQRFETNNALGTRNAVQRYFGDDDLTYYMQEHRGRGVMEAYMTWAILDHRPKKKSKTEAEKMLAKGLPEPEAILLRARIESHPSLYRVTGRNVEAGTFDLEDVLLGGAVTARGPLLSEGIQKNMCLPARVFTVGDVCLTTQVGPLLDAGMESEAIEFLRNANVEFTPEGLRRDAHQFGRLWAWMDQWLDGTMPLEEASLLPDFVDVSPEIASSLQELTNRQYMEWIDTRHPALGETPRQACRVESGRREVAKLIRAIPDPDGPAPIEIPRQAMMRELGLDDDAGSDKPRKGRDDDLPAPVRTAASKPKVARNAPCPCGSGHKYKKCCGRLQSH